MTDNPAQSPAVPSPEAVAQGYEPADLNIRRAFGVVGGCAVGGVVIFLLVWWFMKVLLHRAREVDVPTSAIIDQRRRPSPNLQPSVVHDTLPYQDLELLRSQEDATFLKLGWRVDTATHRLTIPESIAKQVQAQEASRASRPATLPTATPAGINTILPGRPATQSIHAGKATPQGPSTDYPGDSFIGPSGNGSGKQGPQTTERRAR